MPRGGLDSLKASTGNLAKKAMAFHALHKTYKSKPLILPNVWNPLSAKIFEQAGFKAIATTSSGIAASLGYPDGEKIPKKLMFDMVRLIAQSVDIPVSMDFETGYGRTLEEICANVQTIIDAGVVGINIEDENPDKPGTLFSIEEQVKKIKAIKAYAQKLGVPLFINARTDIFWLKLYTPEKRLGETIRRLKAYEKAGANGVFVPGLSDLTIVEEITKNISIPLNILSGPWVKDTAALVSAGVSRISIGSAAIRDLVSRLQGLAGQLSSSTDLTFFDGSVPYSKLKDMLTDSI